MALYEVIEAPAVLTTDGVARVYGKTGDLVELSDEQAAGFEPASAVRQLGAGEREGAVEPVEPVSIPSGGPITFVDPPPNAGGDSTTEAAGGEGEAAVEAPERDTETGTDSSTSTIVDEPEKAPRRPRGRASADGQD